jgi:hypothetical protein
LEGECEDCEDGLCSRCENYFYDGIERWQEQQFDNLANTEYDRLLEQKEEQGTD